MAKKPIPGASGAVENESQTARTATTGEEGPVSEEGTGQPPFQEQLDEMRDLVRTLVSTVQEARAQTARTEMVREALQDVKADVRAASHAMMMAPAATGASYAGPASGYGAPAVDYANPNGVREGKCGPCQCVDDGCCCFDIKIAKVRAAKPQIEPADMGDIPGLINALEVQMYFTVDGTGFLWPGLATTMDLRADGAPGGPGPWVCIERTVKRICFPKGTTVTAQLLCEAREHDEGLERPIGMKDELGEGLGSITLDCCIDKIFPPMPVEIYLQHGGEGRGMLQVAFYAERVCC